MFLIRWYREYLETKREFRQEPKVCESCETLKAALEIANYEKSKLLERLLEKPAPPVEGKPPDIIRPTMIPWKVRKEMLEAEDRVRAQKLRDAPKPASTEDLEKELLEVKDASQ